MGYFSETELKDYGFKSLGNGVKISTRCAIYDAEKISIGRFSRIDDFCVISGNLKLGNYCHITPQCLFAGGDPGIEIEDFCTFAYGVRVFAQSDDYTGASMTNSLIPKKYKKEIFGRVHIQSQTIIGAGSCVMPGVTVAEGCAIGAMSLLIHNTEPWGIYHGIPARRMRDRLQDARDLKMKFLSELASDDSL